MAEDFTQLPGDPQTGDKLRMESVTVNANDVLQQVATLADGTGNLITSTTDGGKQGLDAHISNASIASTVADGANVALGTTTDADTVNTVIGRLKQIITTLQARLPAALVGGRLDVNVGNTPAVTNANLDVALSTRTKPSDQQHTIIDSGSVTATVSGTVAVDSELTTADLDTGAGTDTRAVVGVGLAESGGAQLLGSAHPMPVSAASLPLPSGASTETTLALIKAKTDNLDVALSTRTKPADTQTVSGTVTANAGTNLNTSALALDSTVAKDATLTGGTQKAIARGGQKGATNTNADITHTAEGADHEALDVQIYHGGVAKDPTAIRALTGADVVTANAGTNLNTSLLALDATVGTTNTEIGGVTETAPATDTASSGLNGRLQRIAQRLTSLIALLPATLGQKTKAGSLAVTLASDQDTLPVSLASVPSHAVTNAGTFAVQESGAALTSLQLLDDAVYGDDAARSKSLLMGAVLDDVSTIAITENQAGYLRMSPRRALLIEGVASGTAVKVDNSAVTQPVSGTVTANAGTNLNTAALALDTTVGTTNTEIGGLTETAPATDTASSGLNGRLQRIAQRLTSLIALLPASLGQKTMSASLAVTVASDQTAVPASQSGTWTVQPGNTANTTAWKVDGSAVTQPVSGTVTVTPPTLTKDTQGATGFSTQDLKDAGRSAILAMAKAVAGATSEAIIATFALSRAFGAPTGSVTSLPNTTVTAGKKFRIQAIHISFISTTTTANTTQIGIRVNTGGAAAIGSNLVYQFPRISWPSATFVANEGYFVTLEIPDGLEIPAGAGVGITHIEAASNGTMDVGVIGYEY